LAKRIIIFAKAPVPGFAKTRLAPLLGAQGAAQLARQMLVSTCVEAGAVHGAIVELCIACAPGQPPWSGPLPAGADLLSEQGEGDLGARLARAAERALLQDDRILLIGTDCPELGRERLQRALDALDDHDAFINPAADGGYVLLGLRRYSPAVFSGLEWSGPRVAADTIERLESMGWSYAIGETLRDIDEPADFEAHFGSTLPDTG
jgi:rSAM/selenodomain-associated transferase 1